MKTFSNLLSGLLALAVLAAMGLGVYYMISWSIVYFRGNDFHVESYMIITVLGVLFLAFILRWTRKRESEIHLLMKKRDIYCRFLTAWSRVLQSSSSDHNFTQDELKNAEIELMLWGNNGVLRAYAAIEDRSQMPKSGAIEKLIRAMRVDTKQQTLGLKKGDLFALFLPEFDDTATKLAGKSQGAMSNDQGT